MKRFTAIDLWLLIFAAAIMLIPMLIIRVFVGTVNVARGRPS